MSSIAKYPLASTGDDVHGRFGQLYGSGAAGKSVLLTQCVAGGMILKETGLLDLVAQLDSDPDYRAAGASKKRAMLLGELGALFAVQPPAQGAQAQPAAAQPAAPVQAAPAQPEPPAAQEQVPEHDTLINVSQDRTRKPLIPKFGVTTSGGTDE